MLRCLQPMSLNFVTPKLSAQKVYGKSVRAMQRSSALLCFARTDFSEACWLQILSETNDAKLRVRPPGTEEFFKGRVWLRLIENHHHTENGCDVFLFTIRLRVVQREQSQLFRSISSNMSQNRLSSASC